MMVSENYSYCFTCYCGILRRSRRRNKPLAHRIKHLRDKMLGS
ncbi:hypothetical protein [Nostoc sp.]